MDARRVRRGVPVDDRCRSARRDPREFRSKSANLISVGALGGAILLVILALAIFG